MAHAEPHEVAGWETVRRVVLAIPRIEVWCWL